MDSSYSDAYVGFSCIFFKSTVVLAAVKQDTE